MTRPRTGQRNVGKPAVASADFAASSTSLVSVATCAVSLSTGAGGCAIGLPIVVTAASCCGLGCGAAIAAGGAASGCTVACCAGVIAATFAPGTISFMPIFSGAFGG